MISSHAHRTGWSRLWKIWKGSRKWLFKFSSIWVFWAEPWRLKISCLSDFSKMIRKCHKIQTNFIGLSLWKFSLLLHIHKLAYMRQLSAQFSSVAQSSLTLCNPMDCSTPGFPVHHQLLELAQTHVHWVGDAIQPSHPLSSPSPPAFNLSQHQGLFQGVSSLHQVDKGSELQLQHQSFQWIFRADFL